jgi:hypothetical protein
MMYTHNTYLHTQQTKSHTLFDPSLICIGRECVMARICQDYSGVSDFMNVRHKLFRSMDYSVRDEQVNQLAILWASVGNTMPGNVCTCTLCCLIVWFE